MFSEDRESVHWEQMGQIPGNWLIIILSVSLVSTPEVKSVIKTKTDFKKGVLILFRMQKEHYINL